MHLGFLLPALSAPPAPATIDLILGNGCFWALQYLVVTKLEEAVLGRDASTINALTGYAGGTRSPTGRLCYHNANNTDDYGALGHAESVQVTLPADRHASALHFLSLMSHPVFSKPARLVYA